MWCIGKNSQTYSHSSIQTLSMLFYFCGQKYVLITARLFVVVVVWWMLGRLCVKCLWQSIWCGPVWYFFIFGQHYVAFPCDCAEPLLWPHLDVSMPNYSQSKQASRNPSPYWTSSHITLSCSAVFRMPYVIMLYVTSLTARVTLYSILAQAQILQLLMPFIVLDCRGHN